MIAVTDVCVYGYQAALRGMRNPYDSWEKSDSYLENGYTVIGNNDLSLMKRLYKAGTEHRKYLRQIFVTMDITAPLYWWKQFDKYQIAVTTNSCSTMHTIAKKQFSIDDFSMEIDTEMQKKIAEQAIENLEKLRLLYLVNGRKEDWRFLIQMLPSSYNQKRTVSMNYEVAATICRQRTGHRLAEWDEFIKVLKEQLPYLNEIMKEQ